MTLLSLSVCMILSGASGMLGAVFEVRSPVTFFALMLLLQCGLEIAWFFLEAIVVSSFFFNRDLFNSNQGSWM